MSDYSYVYEYRYLYRVSKKINHMFLFSYSWQWQMHGKCIVAAASCGAAPRKKLMLRLNSGFRAVHMLHSIRLSCFAVDQKASQPRGESESL
jgi:hypothetical protein